MHVGLLTAPFGDKKSLNAIVRFAADNGFKALEITTGPSGHVRPADVLADKGAAVRKAVESSGVSISSLAFYDFGMRSDPAGFTRSMSEILAAAALIGVDTVCTFAGFPSQGMSKLQTIEQDLPAQFGPIVKEAARLKVRIAFENWFETTLQNVEHFRALCRALPQENVGFNFDPSHLHWQGIDVCALVEELKGRIFHTHAKDVSIYKDKLAVLGVLEVYRWWQYSIPGYGDVPWAAYVRTLKRCGYDGVLSIEHEDPAFGVEEGFVKGQRFLNQWL